LRIIAGQFKGRNLARIQGRNIRPTSDRVREAIFNILARKPNGSAVLDLFCGSGALGLEALSRGARTAVFIDIDDKSLAVLRKNISLCCVAALTRTIRWDIEKDLNCLHSNELIFDLVFMDPPYKLDVIQQTLQHLIQRQLLAQRAIVVVEHSINANVDPKGTGLIVVDHRQYGRTTVTFLSQ